MTVIGLELTVSNLVAVIVGCQAQVRVIEEPYLRRVHGTAFAVCTTRVGRFLPGLGRAHVGSSNLTVPGGHGPLSGYRRTPIGRCIKNSYKAAMLQV